MRRYCRLLTILCAFAVLLTACGGAGPEVSDGFLSLPDKQTASGESDGQNAPPVPDAPPVAGETDAQGVTDEPSAPPTQAAPDTPPAPPVTDAPPVPDTQAAPDAPPVAGEPDAQGVTDEPDTPPVSHERDAQFVSGEHNAQLSGETLPEAEAMGEGVIVGKLTEVYLPENERYVPFLVLSDNYGGNALLLRRDVLPERRPFNNYSAAYEDSAIDRFLNGEYLQRLAAVGPLIRASEIVVTDADALGVSGEEVKTLTRSVFPLSCEEIGFTGIYDAGKEGNELSYFNDLSRRIARGENGAAASWWLRTPDAYYLSAVYGVGPDGSLGSGNAYNENGVRPALCVAPDAQAFPTADIVAGQTVYFLKS